MFSQNCNLEVLSLGHGNYGMQMDSNVFLGADKLKILDLGKNYRLGYCLSIFFPRFCPDKYHA